MKPRTYLIGCTRPCFDGLDKYLTSTGQTAFMQEFMEAERDLGPMALVSFYAKLCYKSLVLGKNANVTAVRGIQKNVEGCFNMGHGSVFEHVTLNFVTTDCSRVFTHELVRHRVGTAFSQTSGRYVSVEEAELVMPPEMDQVALNPDEGSIGNAFRRKLQELKDLVADGRRALNIDEMPMAQKKWWTSQLRRIMPSGQTNEIGWSCNIRSLRHMILMRTSVHAEWEIRVVFNDVAAIIEEYCPLMLYGLEKSEEDQYGLVEYTDAIT